MKEKLPGLTQLLAAHHVKEIIDEVTCWNRESLVKADATVLVSHAIH